MKNVKEIQNIINPSLLPSGSRIYCSGNAATPWTLLKQMAADETITDVELLSVLLLGEVGEIFDEKVCRRITHRVIFNSHHSRAAVNKGLAKHLNTFRNS